MRRLGADRMRGHWVLCWLAIVGLSCKRHPEPLRLAPATEPSVTQQLCESTEGTWIPTTCGHYVCGWAMACAAVIPGCDCGPGKVFDEDRGCVVGLECTTVPWPKR